VVSAVASAVVSACSGARTAAQCDGFQVEIRACFAFGRRTEVKKRFGSLTGGLFKLSSSKQTSSSSACALWESDCPRHCAQKKVV
jgi:hypothetical protein